MALPAIDSINAKLQNYSAWRLMRAVRWCGPGTRGNARLSNQTGGFRHESFIRKCTPLGPYRKPITKVLGGGWVCGRFLMSEVPLYPEGNGVAPSQSSVTSRRGLSLYGASLSLGSLSILWVSLSL